MQIPHDDFVYALMLLLFSDMRAFKDKEHVLYNESTGELLLKVESEINEME